MDTFSTYVIGAYALVIVSSYGSWNRVAVPNSSGSPEKLSTIKLSATL